MSPEEKLRLMNIAEAAALIAHYIEGISQRERDEALSPQRGAPAATTPGATPSLTPLILATSTIKSCSARISTDVTEPGQSQGLFLGSALVCLVLLYSWRLAGQRPVET